MVFWGPIIGAGISAISSLFGGKKEEKTTTTIDYGAMARAAEKAGFNPLSALRNGGSSGFQTVTHPGLTMMDRFGQALGTMGNAMMAWNPQQDALDALEIEIKKSTLDRIQKGGLKQDMWSFDVPTSAGARRIGGGGSDSPVGPKVAASLGSFVKPNPVAPTVTNPVGGWWQSNPDVMDANAFTQRFGEGEIAETLLLLGIGGSDLKYNIDRWGKDAKTLGDLQHAVPTMLRPSWIDPWMRQ